MKIVELIARVEAGGGSEVESLVCGCWDVIAGEDGTLYLVIRGE